MTISALPDAPSPGDSTAEFNSKAFAWAASLGSFVTEANALASGVNNDAAAAASAASTATDKASEASAGAAAAAAASGATSWISGTSYAIGDVVYSLTSFQTYRRKVSGAGTTDPSGDPTKWQQISSDVTLAGVQTLTNKTLGSGSTWQGNAVGVAYGGTGANTLSGIVKGNGSSAFTAATPDTDYVTPSGTGTLYNKTFSGSCTWNGNAVGVAYGGTGVTSLTGMVKGNGTGAFSAAVAGTDYVAPSGALGTPSSGNLSNCLVDGTNEIGYRNIPQVSKSAAYTLVLSDAGKHIYHPSDDTTARTWTIPSNASVAYPIGTAITFVNDSSAGTITLAITSDTLVMSPSGSTGSRTLAANGVATAIKVTSTRWVISGTGLS